MDKEIRLLLAKQKEEEEMMKTMHESKVEQLKEQILDLEEKLKSEFDLSKDREKAEEIKKMINEFMES